MEDYSTVASTLKNKCLIEEFCIKNAIVLIDSIQRWRKESGPDVGFLDLLIKNYQSINTEQWMECFANEQKMPFVWPPTDDMAISPLAVSPEAEQIRKNYKAIILQESPVLVVGVLDPFEIVTVKTKIAAYLKKSDVYFVIICPDTFVKLSALAERGVTTAVSPSKGEDYEEWLNVLNYDGDFLDADAIVSSFWQTDLDVYPVIPPFQYNNTLEIKDVPGVRILYQTATNMWVAMIKSTNELLHQDILQKASRKLKVLSVGPNEYKRIVSESVKVNHRNIELSEDSQICVNDWKFRPETPDSQIYDAIVETAIQMGASDIHVEPKPQRARLRFRIDGDLYEQAPLTLSNYNSYLQRCKIMGNMLASQNNVQQSGSGHYDVGGARYDLRFWISILNGGRECVVTRIFSSRIPKLEELKLPDMEMRTIQWFLAQERGMLVTTGPTGSGKTTTLYACLQALDSPKRCLVTTEDPVEKFYENARQISVNSNISYQGALAGQLRQDPDVMMVGEIRTIESAQNALQAASTGHLVLTTVHANDAVGVIERMCGSFGIDHISMSIALRLSIAQRLVSKLCPHCKVVDNAKPEDLRPFPQVDVARPVVAKKVGCPACKGTGYMGRMVIMEMLQVDDQVMSLIETKASPTVIRSHNQNRGFKSLEVQAAKLLFTGVIDIEEAKLFLTRHVI